MVQSIFFASVPSPICSQIPFTNSRSYSTQNVTSRGSKEVKISSSVSEQGNLVSDKPEDISKLNIETEKEVIIQKIGIDVLREMVEKIQSIMD